jgi:hypothetical protein
MSNKELYCSPQVEANAKQSGTCFSLEYLRLVAHMYNRHHDDKIDTSKKKTKKQLWSELNKRLKNKCDNEACWLEQPFFKESKEHNKIEKRFRPKKPHSWYKNPNEWLNTYDILDVMKQYELRDKTYNFVGVFPIDFASKNSLSSSCVSQEMCNLVLADQWKKGIKKVGVVFNTDKSTGSGQHWISLFIGLDPKKKNFGVYFYDSVASNPPREVRQFMKKMAAELQSLHPKYKANIEVKSNKIQKQFKDSNCGIFSILFQIMMFKSRFDDVCENMGKDDDVQRFRDVLYRPTQG